MKVYSVGIIGAGIFGREHFKAIYDHPQLKLVAIADINRENTARFASEASKYSIDNISVYNDHHEMLKDDSLDVILVCTPPAQTPIIAVDCLEAGKHVFMEKPIALTKKDAEHLMRTTRKHQDLTTMVDFIYFGEKGFRKMHELKIKGEIGVPYMYEFYKENELNVNDDYLKKFIKNYLAHEVGPGFMSGTHYLFSLYMMEGGFNGLFKGEGRGHKNEPSYPFSNYDRISLYFRNNTLAEIDIGWLASGNIKGGALRHEIIIKGSEGTIKYDPKKEEVILYPKGRHRTQCFHVPKNARLRNMWNALVNKLEGKETELFFPDIKTGFLLFNVSYIMNEVIKKHLKDESDTHYFNPNDFRCN